MSFELSLHRDELFLRSLQEVSVKKSIGGFDYACLESKTQILTWYKSATVNFAYGVVPESVVPTGCTKTIFFNLAGQICVFNVNSVLTVTHYQLVDNDEREIEIQKLERIFGRPVSCRADQDALLVVTKGAVSTALMVHPNDARRFVRVFEKARTHDQNLEVNYTSALKFAQS